MLPNFLGWMIKKNTDCKWLGTSETRHDRSMAACQEYACLWIPNQDDSCSEDPLPYFVFLTFVHHSTNIKVCNQRLKILWQVTA